MVPFLQFPSCGIDISDSAIKYALLKKTGQKLVLDRHGEHVLPEGIVSGGLIADPGRLQEILSKIREEMDTPYVIASLPEEKGYVIEMFLPADLPAAKIREAVELHLEERVPVSAQEAVFDYERGHQTVTLSGTMGI